MERKYLVVVYRNLRSLNDYNEFTDNEIAEHFYKYMLKIVEEQKEEKKDERYYILDVRLYELIDIEE